MIKPDAVLRIERIPLERLQVKEYQRRYPDRLLMYIQSLHDHPGEYAGILSVVPSDTHPGMFTILDGHHRYCASIFTGRPDALCVIIEE